MLFEYNEGGNKPLKEDVAVMVEQFPNPESIFLLST